MADCVFFSMGEFRAEFPTDRMYARNHMWGQTIGNDNLRFGFSAYAVRLLQDVYFLEWIVPTGTSLAEKQEIGQIESQKAEASLYAPVAGNLDRFNDTLLRDPSAINVDKYGTGWLFELTANHSALLTPNQYLEHLAAVWEITQRPITGQLN